MGTPKNSILLNGKLYDTQSGVSISGSVKSSSKSSQTVKDVKENGTSAKSAYKKRNPARHVAAHHPEHSKTLVRSIHSKPTGNQTHASAPKQKAETKNGSNKHDLGSNHKQQDRINRAKNINKSRLVSRFGTDSSHHPQHIKKTEHLSVKTPPPDAYHEIKEDGWVSTSSDISATKPNTWSFDINNKALPTYRQPSHEKRAAGKKPKKQLHHKRHLIIAIVIAVAIVGFISWQYKPKLEMHLAGSRAGINAKLPGYSPSGYSYNGLKQGSGAVTAHFKSNSDERAYSVSESVSSWNSHTLLQTAVLGANTEQVDYQTVERGGKTIFIFNGSATWVESGVWYQINANSNLGNDQLIKIADSL